MKNALKRSLSILLAITIIFSSAYVGLGELDYSGLFAFNPFKDLIVKSEAASETDLTFELNEDGQSYSVVSCNKNVSGEIVIPDTYNDLPVTSIDSYAFNYCQLITSVVIPDSVTSIGNSAFNRCTKLENVTIPEALISIGEGAFKCTNLTSVTIPDTVTTIGDEAFYDCASLVSITVNENNTSYSSVDGVLFNKEKTEIIHYPANKADEEYTIPNTVTSIGSYAFYNCKNITSVTIPDSVTRIYEYNFYTCTNLVSINVDENNAYFFSFDGVLFNKSKTNLINYPIGKTETEYTVPDGVTQISDNAFFNSANLISITIPDSVTSIGVDAFYGCKNLNVLNIEDIASWCAIDFIYDDEIGDFPGTYANPMLYAENLYLNGELVTDLVIPEGVTSISRNAFDGCTSITSVTIPESVTDIGRWAFNGCTNLNAVYITNITNWCNFGFNVSLEDDGGICDYFSNPLYYAKKLYLNGELVTDLVIPDGVTNIANGTFYNYDRLTSVTIPDSVTNIGYDAFFDCSNLKTVEIGNSVTSIASDTFKNCEKLSSITLPDGLLSIGYSTFSGCSNLKHIDIPSSVTSIGGSAFYECYSLESVTIPDGVTEISRETFKNCNSLTSIVIPVSVTKIHNDAFLNYYNNDLEFVFYAGSESDWANINIYNNTELSNAVIHYNSTGHTYDVTVESVGSCTQNGVTHKKCTVCGYTETIETSATGHDFVDGICTVCGAENTFEYSIENDTVTITGYTGTDTDIIIPSTIEGLPVTVISDSAFYNCDSITSVIIPDSVITLGSYAFDSCTNLSSVKISDNITSIEKYTFKYCSNLESVELGEGITKIDDCAFENCSKLSSIVFPDALTSIGYRAFGECSNLTSVSIPNNVETIGSAAFSMCTKLDSVTIGCGLTNIDGRAFSGCENLVSISVDEDNIAFSSSDGILFNKDKTVLIKYPEGKTNTAYIIPDSVISIGDSAFFNCDNLTSITIPDSVTSIGNRAFRYCYYLTSVTLGNSVTSIGDDAFYSCDSLTSITIPNSVINIGNYAFAFCYNLTSVTIIDGVTCIGNHAFFDCTSLTTITIPDSVTSIGRYAFYNTGYFNDSSNWEDDVLYIGKHLIGSEHSGAYTIKIGTKTIADEAFAWSENLTSIIIPDSVTNIGEGTFYACTGLTSITIPKSVTSIGNGAFYNCNNLADVFYSGTQNEWSAVTIEDGNDCLINATIHFVNPHTYSDWVVTLEPTCTEDGLQSKNCSDCGDVVTEVIDALGHDYSIEWTIDKAATCTTNGSKSHHCSRCDSKTDVTVIAATGHIYGDWVTDREPTCTGEGSKHKTCSVCQNVVTDTIDALGHDYSTEWTIDITPTCTKEGSKSHHCSRCNSKADVTVIPAIGHSYSDWVVTSEPTCTKEGSKKQTCSNCGDIVTDTIDALGHDYSTELIVDFEPTCTVDGHKSQHCSRCDSKANGVIIPAIGHNYSDWVVTSEPTCTKEGLQKKTCSKCGDVVTEAIDSLGHDYSTEWTIDKAVTCTTDGSKSRHCSRCNDKTDITVITATGHVYGEWVTDREPNCTVAGSKHKTCSVCQNVVTETIEALGHDYSSEWTIDKAATCIKDGSKSRHCSRCNSKTEVTVIAATGHLYGDWIIDTEATVLSEGAKHRICSVCSNKETQVIEKVEIDIESNTDYGLAVFTVVHAQTLEPISGAQIFISTENDGENTFTTDSNGQVSVVLPVGKQVISAYAEGCLTRNLKVNIKSGINEIPQIGLSDLSTYDAELTSKLMTIEEIEAAGIDTSDPDNQHVYKYELKLEFVPEIDIPSIVAYFNGAGEFIGGYDNTEPAEPSEPGEPSYNLHYHIVNDGYFHSWCKDVKVEKGQNVSLSYVPWRDSEDWVFDGWYEDATFTKEIHSVDIEEYTTTVYGRWIYIGDGPEPKETNGIYIPATENREALTIYPVSEYFYLIIRGEVRWLKEMFDVEMLVINNSLTDTLEDLTATLELPEGLSLAKMVGEQQSLIQEIDHIAEGESESVHWYVRGDKEGSYNLEARLQGTIMPFEEEIDDLFVAENQLQVLAGSALSLHFEFPDAAYYGEDYPITITLTNTSDRTLYNISHMIQVEQGMVVYYSDGTSKEKVDTSTSISSGVIREFNPGDKIIIEGSVNIFFKSEMMERELEKYIGLIDGIEQLINGYKAVTAALDIFKFLDNCVTGCTKAMDDFIASAAESSDKLELFKELHSKLSSLYTSYSTTGNKTLDAAIDLANTGLNSYLNAITEDPDVWFATHSAEDIKALLADIEVLENSIIAPKQPTKKFDIFDSLRTAISAIPVRFALKNVIMTEDENNTTSIPWSYSTTKAGPQYFGVSNVSKYMISLVQMIGAEAYEASMPGIFMAIPGVDDPFNKDEAIKYIQATENEIAQFKAKDATGEVKFKAWVERNEASTYSLRSSSTSPDFALSCDNDTATYEDGVLTFTGDGMISVTPQSQTGGTLYIEDSEGNTYTYVIDVVEQHTCECGEREVVVSPTAEFDGFAVKSCTVCSEIMEVEVLAYDNCCEEHTFTEWVEEERKSCTDSTLRSRCCSVCGFTETEVVSGTSHTFVDGVCSECGIENSDESLFDYEIADDSVTITDCEITDGEVVIPDEINGLPVTEIGSSAFVGSEDITSIVIPDSVTNIGDSAFENCDSLEYIFYPGSESDWENISIGDNNSAITDAIIHYGSTVHTYVEKIDVEATCTEEGSKHLECSVCGYSLESEVISALGHEYSTEWTIDVEATCTEDGSKSHHCSRCDSKVDVTVITATGHIYGEWNVTSEPTCTEEGSQSKICSACDVAVTEAIEALGHSYSTEWTIDVEATCTEDGSKSHHCSRCDSKIDVTVISAKHSYSDWVIDNEATCTQDGKKHRICSACGNIETKNILATGHNFVNSYCTTCGVEEAFKYSIDNGCVTIIGYNGRNPYPYRWDVVIPSEIEGFPVVTIGSRAFRSTGINNVTIPNSVTSIEELAFYNCNSLTSVTIGNSVSNIGAQAFDSCIYLTDVIIPDSVTNIGHHAFNSCDRLTSISIPDSVTSIGDYAFNSCDRLATVTIGNGVTSIGNNVFNYCRNLAMVTIGNSVKSIGDYAFGSCENLVSITIPNSVTSIGDSAFSYCYSLTSITIPDSVITLGDSAFNNCINLTSITIGNGVTSIGNHTFWNCRKLSSIIIPYNVTSIGDYVFSHCDSLDYVFYPGSKSEWDSITLGSSNDLHTNAIIHYNSTDHIYGDWIIDVEPTCTEDGEKHHVCSVCNYSESAVAGAKHSYSDGYCTVCGEEQLFEYSIENDCVTITGYLGTDTDVIIPATIEGLPVTTISDAFRNCSTITSICVPETVTSIGNFAFYGCTSLTTIELPSGLTKINYRSFGNCDSLTSIVIPDGVTCIDYYAFDSCANLTSVTIPDSVTTIGESAFYNCEKLSSVEIGNGITNIENGAFRYCISLTDVYIKDISAWCNIDFATYDSTPLYYAQNLYVNGELLTDLIIPGNVTSIKNYAFYSCESIVSVKISNSVINIGAWAFNDCTKLELVVISDSVTDIDETAFRNCPKMHTIYVGEDNKNYSSDNGVLFNKNKSSLIKYPANKSYFEYIIPDTITTISKYAFNNSDIKAITIPENVTTIDDYAFKNCTSLTNVYYLGLLSDWDKISIGSNNECLTNANISHLCTLGDWVIDSEATCTEDGSRSKTCKVCGKAVTETIKAPGHSYSDEWTIDKAATCIANGSKSHHCTVCGDKTDVTVIVSGGHNYVVTDALSVHPHTTSYKCSYCEDEKTEAPVIADCIECNFTITLMNSTGYKLVSYIGEEADVVIPATYEGSAVTTIANSCFKGNSSITTVEIEEGVTTIGSLAFMNCTSLEIVYIPASVTSIGTNAFFGFTGTIYCAYGSTAYKYAIANKIDYIIDSTEELETPIQETEDTEIDFNNFIIFTNVKNCSDITEILGLSESATVIPTASCMNGNLELYGTGTIITVFDGNDYIGDFTLIVEGDLNGDSVCNVLDAFEAERASNGHIEASTEQIYAANGMVSDEINVSSYQNVVNKGLAS